MGLFRYCGTLYFCLLVLETYVSGSQHIGRIYPGFEASQTDWIDTNGVFLLSNNSVFSFGFYTAVDVKLFVLVVTHISSATVVWTANRGLLISNSDKFVFGKNGNVYLQRSDGVAWSTNTSEARVRSMELWDSGNLVLLGDTGSILWQSFSHPTDTLLPGQEFLENMRLKSFPTTNNLSVYLEIKSGDLILYAGYRTPQTYWSLAQDNRKTNNGLAGKVHSASLVSNAWNFYDQNKVLLWQFIIPENSAQNATWAAILGSDGAIRFYNLQKGKAVYPEAIKIPKDSCSVPEPCSPYYVCYFENWCQCPRPRNSNFSCKSQIPWTCSSSKNSADMVYVGEKLDYFALEFVTPFSGYNLEACKKACLHNCSCAVLFFENSAQSCFLFDQIGSLQRSQNGSSSYILYVKESTAYGGLDSRNKESENSGKIILITVFIVVGTIIVIAGLLYVGLRYHYKNKRSVEFPQESLEEEDLLDSLPGMPVRYNYSDLCMATKSFSTKLGQGGFGSVYLGVLADGTHLAVKKLEGIGQGKKEFRAEISVIGSVHHVHLVKLIGFCMERAHRLLVYEYMGNGSLDKWIFKTKEESQLLSWNARFNIALATAKGLAYLHEECEAKIVHCDIKPENVLLDDNFTAKVSDFGLAKLMKREDSLVYTTVRGTRGYLAPEWITNSPISEKTDVYSYGVVLLEIIRGRKSYDMGEHDSEKAHLPTYVFKMLEEGKLKEILDPSLDFNPNDMTVETVIKVALWCVQDDMQLRPPMTKVVQMLEGVCAAPQPAAPSQLSARAYSGFLKWSNEEGTSSGQCDEDSGACLSDIRLSGPR